MRGRRARFGVAAARAVVAQAAVSALAALPAGAQEAERFGLADLFVVAAEEGTSPALLRDENGDGVPDRLGAAIVSADAPTLAERAAAAEIAARLGFETMVLDLARRGLRGGTKAAPKTSRNPRGPTTCPSHGPSRPTRNCPRTAEKSPSPKPSRICKTPGCRRVAPI